MGPRFREGDGNHTQRLRNYPGRWCGFAIIRDSGAPAQLSGTVVRLRGHDGQEETCMGRLVGAKPSMGIVKAPIVGRYQSAVTSKNRPAPINASTHSRSRLIQPRRRNASPTHWYTAMAMAPATTSIAAV